MPTKRCGVHTLASSNDQVTPFALWSATGGARPRWRAADAAEERPQSPSLPKSTGVLQWGHRHCEARCGILDRAYELRPTFGCSGLTPSPCCRCTPTTRKPSSDAVAEVRPGPHKLASSTTACTSAPNLLGRPKVPWVPKATAASPLLARHNLHGRRRHASRPARPATSTPALPIRARAAGAHAAPSPRPGTIGSTAVQRPAHAPPLTSSMGKSRAWKKRPGAICTRLKPRPYVQGSPTQMKPTNSASGTATGHISRAATGQISRAATGPAKVYSEAGKTRFVRAGNQIYKTAL